MLQLDDRTLFLDALKPPPDYELDFVVGTTFSLDIVAALQIPLAFTQHHFQRDDAHQLMSLDAMKRFTDRMLIFCQSGRISSPRNYPILFSYMEQTIFEIALKDGGSFHPKVWVLRYHPEIEDAPIRYRFLCLSRNLTDDKSWDTALILEGTLAEHRTLGYGNQKQVSEFFKELPKLVKSGSPISANKLEFIDIIANEIHRVQFEAPSELEIIDFHPLLPTNRQQQFPFNPAQRISKALVISPFVTAHLIKNILKLDKKIDFKLVTRLEEAQKGGESLWETFPLDENGICEGLFVVNPDALPTDDDDEQLSEFSGLHAKLFMFDLADRTTHIFTGSANASGAAFKKNVEFLIELRGKRHLFGTDVLLSHNSKEDTLYHLLKPFQPLEEQAQSTREQAEEILENIRTELIAAKFNVNIQASPDDENFYRVIIDNNFIPTESAMVSVRPATINQDPKPLIQQVVFTGQTMLYLTAFYEFHLSLKLDNESFTLRFILKLPVTNMPEDREKHIIRSYLDTPEKFMRFMLMMLADNDDPDDLALLLEFNQQNNSSTQNNGLSESIPLFETLVKALYKNPQRLDDINEMIEALKDIDDNDSILPAQFNLIWEPLYRTRQKLESEQN